MYGGGAGNSVTLWNVNRVSRSTKPRAVDETGGVAPVLSRIDEWRIGTGGAALLPLDADIYDFAAESRVHMC